VFSVFSFQFQQQ